MSKQVISVFYAKLRALNFMKVGLALLLVVVLLGFSACKDSDTNEDQSGTSNDVAVLSQDPVTLSFYSETFAEKLEEFTLQSENAALLYALGEIAIDEKGHFSIGYGPIDVEDSVYFPGNSGTVEAKMSITDANWEGSYNSKTQVGSGDYNFTYLLGGSEAGSEATVEVNLKGDLSLVPSQLEAHKGRVELTLTGTATRNITLGGKTSKVIDDNFSVTYVYDVR